MSNNESKPGHHNEGLRVILIIVFRWEWVKNQLEERRALVESMKRNEKVRQQADHKPQEQGD